MRCWSKVVQNLIFPGWKRVVETQVRLPRLAPNGHQAEQLKHQISYYERSHNGFDVCVCGWRDCLRNRDVIWGYLFAGSLLKDGGGMVMIFESLCSLLIF